MRTATIVLFLAACHQPQPAGQTNTKVVDPAVEQETVQREAPAVAPLRGGGLVKIDARYMAAADPDGDRIVVFDATARLHHQTIELPEYAQPFRLVSDGTSIFATLAGTQQVGRYDWETGEVLWEVSPCVEPRGLALDGSDLHLACASGELLTLDAETGERLAYNWLGTRYDDLRDAVIDPTGMFVTRFRSAEVLLVDPGTLQIQDLMRPPTLRETNAPFDVDEITTMAPAVAWKAVKRPGGGVIVLHQREELEPVLLDPPDDAGDRGADDPVPPSPYGSDPTQPHCMGILHPTWTEFTAEGNVILGPVLSSPALVVDLALDPGSNRFLLAGTSNDDQLGRAVARSVDREISAGQMGCVQGDPMPGGSMGQVTSVAWGTQPVLVTRAPFTVLVGEQQVFVPEVETRPEMDAQKYGWQVFHTATDSGISCANCHPEGGEDGHVWTFERNGQIEVRRTPMFGGVLKTSAPYHWDGEFDQFSDLVESIFMGRMGGSASLDLSAESMLEWLDTLPPRDAFSRHLEPADIERGKEIFEDPNHGCITCHATEQLTNNQSYDVGTGLVLQVPTLRGVGTRGPWMHDGCAETLEDRFTDLECGGTNHGGPISQSEISPLVAYLQTL